MQFKQKQGFAYFFYQRNKVLLWECGSMPNVLK